MHYSKQKTIFGLRLKFTLMASVIMMLMAAVTFITLGITMYNQRLDTINDAMNDALDSPYQIEASSSLLLNTSPWNPYNPDSTGTRGYHGQYLVYVYSIDDFDGSLSVVAGSQSMSSYKETIAEDAVQSIERGKIVDLDSIGMYAMKKSTNFGQRIAFVPSEYLTDYMTNIIETLVMTYAVVIVLFIGITTIVSSRLSDPIEKTWAEQEEFIQNASHELRTPIAIVKANMDVLRGTTSLPKESQQYIDASVEAIDGMNELVNDMLYFATSSSKKGLQMKTTNVSKLVEKTCMSFDSIAIEKTCFIDSDGIDEKLFASVDEKAFNRIMSILLDNACKYSDSGTKITVSAHSEKRHVIIMVNDFGASIKKGDEEIIFDRFYRSDKARLRQGGYGLGLAMAKELVENMNGEISAESEIDKGTTFTVSFKAEKPAN